MEFDELDDIMDVDTLTIVLGLSKNTVLKLLRAGEIPGKRVGRKWRVTKEMLIRYLHGK